MTAEAIFGVSDDRLMCRVVEGDHGAFETIHERYRPLVFAMAMRMMRQPAAAEEVTQEAFLSLWRSAARYEPSRSTLRSWLLLLVRSRGIDSIRSGTRHGRDITIETVGREHLQAPGSTVEEVAKRDESRQMRQLVTNIPGKQRQVIELAFFNELTHGEIAKRLELPLGTVKGRLRLALARLHQALSEECAVAAG
jgi:RNA polymerase sigma-70 factor, ECF subfamily